MNRRELAEQLYAAAAHLDPVDLMAPEPLQCLTPAFELAMAVWKELGEKFGSGTDGIDVKTKGRLRIALVGLRNVHRAAVAGSVLRSEDTNLLKMAASEFRGVAPNLEVDPRTRRMVEKTKELTFARSSRGLRQNDIGSLTGGVPHVIVNAEKLEISSEEAPETTIAYFESFHSKLPTTVKQGGFAFAKMPILVYPNGGVRTSALDRSGVNWIYIHDPAIPRVPGTLPRVQGIGSSIVLRDQIVVGFRKEDLKDDPELMERTTKQISARMGPHVNPTEGKTFRSPGNSLEWMWLAQTRLVNSSAFSIRAIAFPWAGTTMPESHKIYGRERLLLERELNDLLAQQEYLNKKGLGLEHEALRKISNLMDKLNRDEETNKVGDTPAEKMDRQRNQHLLLEDRMNKNFRRETIQIDEIEKMLQTLGKPKEGEIPAITKQRRNLMAERSKLKTIISDGRTKLMKDMRDGKL